jgi:hypothetical protein
MVMSMHMDGWKVSYDGTRAKIFDGPCWAVVTYFRSYDGREVPESHIVESLHKDRPALDRVIEKFQYPAPGSIKLYDFAYGRMATGVAYREGWSSEGSSDFTDEHDNEFVFSDSDTEDQPGVEKVYRKVDVVRLTAAEVQDLYVDWAHARVLRDGDPAALEFALHVLAELGGEI